VGATLVAASILSKAPFGRRKQQNYAAVQHCSIISNLQSAVRDPQSFVGESWRYVPGDTRYTRSAGLPNHTRRLLRRREGCDRHPRNSGASDANPAGGAKLCAFVRGRAEVSDRTPQYPIRRSRTLPGRAGAPARANIPGWSAVSTRERNDRRRRSVGPEGLRCDTNGRFPCRWGRALLSS